MPQIEELVKNVERALSELKAALVPAESSASEPVQNQADIEAENEKIFEQLNIRF